MKNFQPHLSIFGDAAGGSFMVLFVVICSIRGVFCEIFVVFPHIYRVLLMNFECHERLWWCSGCVVPSPISEVSKNYKYLLDSHQWQFYEK